MQFRNFINKGLMLVVCACADTAGAPDKLAKVSSAAITPSGHLRVLIELSPQNTKSRRCFSRDLVGVEVVEARSGYILYENPPEEPGLGVGQTGGSLPAIKAEPIRAGTISRLLPPWPGAYREDHAGMYAGDYSPGTPIAVRAVILTFACEFTWSEAITAGDVGGIWSDAVDVTGDVRSFIGSSESR